MRGGGGLDGSFHWLFFSEPVRGSADRKVKEVRARQVGEKGAGPHPGPTYPLPSCSPTLPLHAALYPHTKSCLLLDHLLPVDPRRGASPLDTHVPMLSSPT